MRIFKRCEWEGHEAELADYMGEMDAQERHDNRTALVERYEMEPAEVAAMTDFEVAAELDRWRCVDAMLAGERRAEACLAPGYAT